MRTIYAEITENFLCTQITVYTPEQYEAEMVRRKWMERWRRREIERVRQIRRREEFFGSILMGTGFFTMMLAESAANFRQCAVLCVAGLALFVFGGWLSHAFYGQESKAQWLRSDEE